MLCFDDVYIITIFPYSLSLQLPSDLVYKPSTMRFLACLLPLLAIVSASMPEDLESILNGWPNNYDHLTPDKIVQEIIETFPNFFTNGRVTDSCHQCKSIVQIGKNLALVKPDWVPEIFTKICILSGIASEDTCRNYMGRSTVESVSAGTDYTNMLQLIDPWSLDGDYICYFILLQRCPLPELPNIDLSSWWPEKPESSYIAPPPSNETFNVLHISDFHIQLDYELGSEGNCTNLLGMCCTDHSWNKLEKPGHVDNSHLRFFDWYYDDDEQFQLGDDVTREVFNASVWDPAQQFGHYKCDSPELLVNSSLKSIVDYQKENDLALDFVIFTGDIVDHDEFEAISYQDTIDSETTIFRDMKKYFKNTPVYSVLGNHDTFPYGQLASEATGHRNLYEWNDQLAAELWIGNGWLPAEKYGQIKKHYTGYSVETSRGLKVIALNSNAYYKGNLYNYWNMTDGIDQYGSLKFLIDELVESESKGQRVWIIAHIPFIVDSIPIQAEAYKQIVTRFAPATIAGLFFGHTHQDEFNVLYAHDNKTIDNALMNTWIAQSVTPWINYNPGWRYYEVDSETFSIVNSYNFYTKLNETFNDDGQEPVWERLYSARESYDPEGKWPSNAPLNATFWATVAEDIKDKGDVSQLYAGLSFRESPFVPRCSEGECDDTYCYVTSFTLNDYFKCTGKF